MIDCKFDLTTAFFAAPVYPLYATTPTAARMPMMATTTRSSMRVKALDLINKLYFKFLDAHMTQCELDSAYGFRSGWLIEKFFHFISLV